MPTDPQKMSFSEAVDYYNAIVVEASRLNLAQRIQVYRHHCLSDLFFLLVYVLHRKDCLHPWLYDRCREVQAAPNGRLDLWARDHYKSTVITFALTIQDILRNPEIKAVIFSHTRVQAKGFLRWIKNELDNNAELKIYF